MTYKDEPGLGTIIGEFGLWCKKKFIKIMWGMEGFREWVDKNRYNDEPQEPEKTQEPEVTEPVDNTEILVARVKEFANCEMVPRSRVSSILDMNQNIIEPRVYRRTFFGEYTNHLKCDVDSSEIVPWDIAVAYMTSELDRYPNRLTPYTTEEVEKALSKANLKMTQTISEDVYVGPFDEKSIVNEALEIANNDKFLVIPEYHTVRGVRFASHLTPQKVIQFKRHLILVLEAVNMSNESMFIMKDLPLNDVLVAKLIKNGLPVVKIDDTNEK